MMLIHFSFQSICYKDIIYINVVCVPIKHQKPTKHTFSEHSLAIISETVSWVQKHLADFISLNPNFLMEKRRRNEVLPYSHNILNSSTSQMCMTTNLIIFQTPKHSEVTWNLYDQFLDKLRHQCWCWECIPCIDHTIQGQGFHQLLNFKGHFYYYDLILLIFI